MSNTIRGTEFSYRIDTEHGINGDGFIAEGTESIVFKGIKYGSDLRYSCALKFKPKYRLYDFMKREYRILESMQTCRSVVRVLDVIEDLGDFSIVYANGEISSEYFFCVVEEYIDGASLQDYCIGQWFTYQEETRRWTRNEREYTYREIVKYQNQIVQFMINLCEIMKFVSNVNADSGKADPNSPIILHCDIKPENIMVTQHGKELVLIDFGRSQALTESRIFRHYSDPQACCFIADYSEGQWQDIGKSNFYSYGTVGFAAPECYAAAMKGQFPFSSQMNAITNGSVSVESDIFGFGATFWQCLSTYEICMNAMKDPQADLSDPSFFNHAIAKIYEDNVHKRMVADYCDRDFRNIDSAYHESLEIILKKCTHYREPGFQEPVRTPDLYYHNYYSLQDDIERARDTIPSLDRKSDPLVRQMVGISGFCSSLMLAFLFLVILLLIFANPLAWDKWNNLTDNYTDNQKVMLRSVADEMMQIPGNKTKYKNFEEILSFMHSGTPNDDVIDQEEAEIIVNLMSEHLTDQSKWGEYLDVIMRYAKSDNMDSICKSVYRMNLSEDYQSAGYELAKAIAQVNDADDTEAEKLIPAYETVLKYSDDFEYHTAVAKLAAKLMTGKKIDTISQNLETDRESIRNTLIPLT